MIIRYYLIKFKTVFIIILVKPMCPCMSFSNKGTGTWEHPGWLPWRAYRGNRGMTVAILFTKENWRLKWGQPPGLPTKRKQGTVFIGTQVHTCPSLFTGIQATGSLNREAAGLQKVLESVCCSGVLRPWGAKLGEGQEKYSWCVRETENKWENFLQT